jgi:NTE family protein
VKIQSRLAGLCVGVLLLSAPVHGQESAPRPRVGLALGGGSARGLAHVGVLRWLEEHRIPVDAIAGTSMGAFIGGAYATGMSAAEIQTMFSETDWDLMLRPDLPFPLKSFRRKEDIRDRPIRFEMGLRRGFRLQSGLNSGHQLGLWLSRLSLPYSTVDRFDDLPIPFRCVATDLGAGETVVLDRGPLGSALRASMSLPGAFDPVWRDGRILADGGILNNVPVDVARSMGVDVVIAVSVTPRRRQAPSESIQGTANRAIRLMMDSLDRPRLEQADVVIIPDTEGLRGSDYRDSEDLAARGYAAAEAQSEVLLPYALDPAAWEAHQARVRERETPVTSPISFVEVTGATEDAAAWIGSGISRNPAKAPDPGAIEAHLDAVIGEGRFASAMYRRVAQGNAQGLSLDLRDKSYAPPLVRFSLDVDNAKRDLNLTFGSRVTFLDVTSLGSEWRFDVSLGSNLGAATEFLQPLGLRGPGGRGLFLAPRGFYSREGENLYSGQDLIALLTRQRAGGGLDLVWHVDRRTELRAGAQLGQAWNRSRVDLASLPDGAEKLVHARLVHEGQDRPYFPTRGLRLEAGVTRWSDAPGAAAPFGQVEGAANLAFRLGQRHHATLQLDGVAEFDGPAPLLYQPGLGGPLHFGALPFKGERGPNLVLGGLGYRFELARLPRLLGDSLYFVGLLEVGSAFDEASSARFSTSGTVGLAADTILGPVFAGASVGKGGNVRVYFMMGASVR